MKIEEKLIQKSQEAFLLAVENFNKPTITYRLEAFAYLICNAWELMLKAHMIKTFGEKSLYYPNSNRTLSLGKCLKKIFTNKNDPLRLNLEQIIELRDTSTHFITEEYEMVYIPLFQSCIFNYNEKMQKFHNIDMTDIIKPNFLTLATNIKSLSEAEIIAKYPKEIADKLIKTINNVNELINNNNHRLAIRIEHHYYLTKDENKASAKIKIDNTSDNVAKIITKQLNPNNTHKYTAKACIIEINKLLKKNGIILHLDNEPILNFNMYHFRLLIDYFGIKQNNKLCFIYNVHSQPSYSYAYQTIEFLFNELKKDPNNIIRNLKNKLKK